MSKLLAIEWDAHEARAVVARTRGQTVIVEDAFAVELTSRDPGQSFADPEVGNRLSAALAARGVGKADTLVAVGRANIELRQLKLPPSPPEELPDLVRFQAMREFTTIGEDWPLDFVFVDAGDNQDEALHVLAAAISKELLRQLLSTCEAADLTPRHVVLRPFAAASLLGRENRDDGRCRLMVDVLSLEADLTVLVDGNVQLMRTVRLPAANQSTALLGEIRRTMGAAQNQIAGRRIERITLCGDEASLGEFRQKLEDSLQLPVDFFNPFGCVNLDASLPAPPAHPGRYASLLGMLVDEAAQSRHAIDFLHPRRRPAPVNHRRRYLLAAATAAVAALALGVLLKTQLDALDGRIAGLKDELANREPLVAAATKRRADMLALDELVASDVIWLDELKDVAEKIPPAQDAIVTSLLFNIQPGGEGQMVLEGLVRESKQIEAIERNLRDERHRVMGKGGDYDALQGDYNWRFSETVYITPPVPLERPEARDDPDGADGAEPSGESPQAEPDRPPPSSESAPADLESPPPESLEASDRSSPPPAGDSDPPRTANASTGRPSR